MHGRAGGDAYAVAKRAGSSQEPVTTATMLEHTDRTQGRQGTLFKDHTIITTMRDNAVI